MGLFPDHGLGRSVLTLAKSKAADDDQNGRSGWEAEAAMDENEGKLSSPSSSSLIGQNHATKSALVPTFNFFNRDRGRQA